MIHKPDRVARSMQELVVDPDVLAIARDRQARGESVTTIARHLRIGRSTLCRALQPDQAGRAG